MTVDPSQRQWEACIADVGVRRRGRLAVDLVLLVLLLLLVAGLTVLKPAVREWRYGPTVAGPVLTTVRHSTSGPTAEIRGVLSERAGCLLVGATPVYWIRGTRWDAAHRTVVFGDGARTPIGGWFDGGGGGGSIDHVVGLDARGLSRLERCDRLAGGVDVVYAYHGG